MTNKIVCSGALFYALDTKRFLFIHRTQGRQKNQWGIVGGTTEGLESPFQGLQREIQEEIGAADILKTMPLESFISNDDYFHFHTYLTLVKQEFIPSLNHEHDGYAWVSFGKWPKPLHHGLRNTLQNKTIQNKLQTVMKVIDLLNISSE